MNDSPALTAAITTWRLDKRTEDGRLFETVEGDEHGPTRVTFRAEGLAPLESYADLPYVRQVTATDTGAVGALDVSHE